MSVVAERERIQPLQCESTANVLVEPASRRIIGFDLARAFAILAMMVDHCAQVLGPSMPTGWGGKLLEFIDGRASAVFVVLAGVGVTLLARRQTPAQIRGVLLRRGAFLLAMGFINQAVWPGDVLRLFGVTMMAAGCLVTLRSSTLLAVAVGIVLAFPGLMLVMDYDAHWDWTTMQYEGLWTPTGTIRNLFFNGFRPVIPWAGLLVFGMWLGRIDTTRASMRHRMLLWGAGLVAGVETVSRVGMALWMKHPHGYSPETIDTICATGSMPPLPVFILTVVGTAMTVIALSLMAASRWPKARLTTALAYTGQMALTWYLFHIAVGALWIWRRGWHSAGTVAHGILFGILFYALLVVLSDVWKRRFKYGPLEWLLRNVSN
ncbi:MAG TPA: DUF418 domain-containing protein [Tepidisphaeraceae bacterium]|jgi:uncharacterized membrane protein YeiB